MSDQPMAQGWWQASDGKWYAPELHPAVRPDAQTQEIPTAEAPGQWPSSGSPFAHLPPPPPPPAFSGPPPEPAPPSGDGNRKLVIGMALVIALLLGGCGALLVALGLTRATDNTVTPATSEASSTTQAERTTTTIDEPTTEPETTTSTSVPFPTSTSTTIIPAPPSPDPDLGVMPDVICMDLQAAKRAIEAAGISSVRTFDATGSDRVQIIHSNWIVVSQEPAAGSPIRVTEATLGVVKKGEDAPC